MASPHSGSNPCPNGVQNIFLDTGGRKGKEINCFRAIKGLVVSMGIQKCVLYRTLTAVAGVQIPLALPANTLEKSRVFLFYTGMMLSQKVAESKRSQKPLPGSGWFSVIFGGRIA